ncbi:NAD-dependent epimerase/dehydratase family protein [Halomontanus rarus]|uniref:NAD-dependent epimerase/dehydratase family protein n=1 Tax=Halomontanus rarus TaxID=3034020 RepID=UPI0023E8A087|nr:NAD(P)-dependent oxidoreductase [Halovivax sp. TS33]
MDRNGHVLTGHTDGSSTRNVQTVLVIGGAGYIGSVLSRQLLEAGYDVRVLDALLYGRHGVETLLDDDRFTLIEGDMCRIDDVVDAIQDVDAVIHLGALVGDPASSINSQKTLEMNLHAVKLAASICKYHQVNRFLFASTCSVYGRDENDGLLTETSVLNPVSLYAQTKIESERALLEMADANFSPTILRMATIYGLSPRMRFDLVVNILTAKAYETNEIPIFGGDQYRPNVHVADAAQAYIDCLEAPIDDVSNEIFNVGSNEQNYRVAEIGEMISEQFQDATIDRQPENEDERSYRVDFSKIEARLGYSVDRTITDGCLEIKQAMEHGRFSDYTGSQYSNYKTLESAQGLFQSV